MPISESQWALFMEGVHSIMIDEQGTPETFLQKLKENWDELHDFSTLAQSVKDREIVRLRAAQTENDNAKQQIEDRLRQLGATP